jgi:hypothetical protein
MQSAVAALLLTFQLASVPVTACVGWESSATARMACCHHEHPNSATTQAEADDCCAKHEQAKQPASTNMWAMPLVSLGPVFVGVALVELDTTLRGCLIPVARIRLSPHGSPGAFAPPLRV